MNPRPWRDYWQAGYGERVMPGDYNSLAASVGEDTTVKELLQGDLPELLASVEQRLDPLQDWFT